VLVAELRDRVGVPLRAGLDIPHGVLAHVAVPDDDPAVLEVVDEDRLLDRILVDPTARAWSGASPVLFSSDS
jgi:hypothetical protein